MVTRQNPFSPGPGAMPAHIVARSKERESIDEALNSTLAERNKNGLLRQTFSPQVIVGPRGVGKTTLMNLAINRASDAGIHIVELDEALLTGHEENLRESITPPSRLDMFFNFLKHFRGSLKFKELFKFEIGQFGKMVPKDLKATLAAGSLAGPMAIFLDEAHTVPVDNMRKFCNAANPLINRGYPLALVIAGTPGLWSLLMNMGGTFMERSKKLSVNLFGADEAREALSMGFEGTGFKVDSKALERLVDWSDRYPYFIQLAGYWTWKQAEGSGADTVTLELAKAGLELAKDVRESFYDTRRTELMNHGVLKEAFEVMEMMANRSGGLDRAELRSGLRRANKGMDKEGAKDLEQKLINLGFLYEGPGRLEPGIPSLFDYVSSKPVEEDYTH